MFELNLIKDKAMARKRRRLIFMSIVSVVLLSGLVTIFVGSLFWQEITALNRVEAEIASTQSIVNQVRSENVAQEPVAIRLRNARINAWLEDKMVRETRPTFTPAMRELYQRRPRTDEFWYNTIQFTTTRDAGGRTEPTGPEIAAALLGTRELSASGYMQVLGSDVVTEEQLDALAMRMSDVMMRVAGIPQFEADFSQKPDEAAMEGGVYVPFRLRASTTRFVGSR
jgi:hypothetical protein